MSCLVAILLPNPIDWRVESVLDIAMSIHDASASGPSAQKGAEREIFVEHVLSEALPRNIRFGTGSVSDTFGNESGQLDIVIEGDAGISFSMPGVPGSRFYVANYVGAVVEVKSDLSAGEAWNDALSTADRLAKVRRDGNTRMLEAIEPSIANMTDPSGRSSSDAQKRRASSGLQQLKSKIDAQPTHIPFYVIGYRGWKNAPSVNLV